MVEKGVVACLVVGRDVRSSRRSRDWISGCRLSWRVMNSRAAGTASWPATASSLNFAFFHRLMKSWCFTCMIENFAQALFSFEGQASLATLP